MKKQDKKSTEEVSDQDLFGSIPKPVEIDPFQGIDLQSISIPSIEDKDSEEWKSDAEVEEIESREINPLEGVDLKDISIQPSGLEEPETDVLEISEINPISGIDLSSLSVRPTPSFSSPQPEPLSQTLKDFPAGTSKKDEVKRDSGISPDRQPSLPTTEVIFLDSANLLLASNSRLARAFRYAEISRIREKIMMALQLLDSSDSFNHKAGAHTLLITSPHDHTGNTFLASVLGYNLVSFEKKSVLLIDMNMRHPGLHLAFGLEQAKGFTNVIKGELRWSEVIKPTSLKHLEVMTAGQPDNQLSSYLHRSFLEKLIDEIRVNFDIVIFDSSPLLSQNRNNVDAVFLSHVSDFVVLVTQVNKTRRGDLQDAVALITSGGGKINGIVYNQQLKKDYLPHKIHQWISRVFVGGSKQPVTPGKRL